MGLMLCCCMAVHESKPVGFVSVISLVKNLNGCYNKLDFYIINTLTPRRLDNLSTKYSTKNYYNCYNKLRKFTFIYLYVTGLSSGGELQCHVEISTKGILSESNQLKEYINGPIKC